MNKIVLTCGLITLVGIILLYYIVLKTELEEVPIERIDNSYLGKTIKVTGKVTSVKYSGGHIFLTIYNKSYINVAIFSNVANFLNESIKKGQRITVVGVLNEYKGRLQVVPRKASDIKVIE